MAITLSPGVFVQEKDLSQIIRGLAITAAGIVIESSKGPVNEFVLVTNTDQFVETFGEPEVDKPSMQSALAYLDEGNQLWVVRVVNDGAEFASTEDDVT